MSIDKDEKYCVIGKRLKEEREKKQQSQDSLGQILSTSKRTVLNWERGASFPDAKELAIMGESLGFDTNYILTGERMPLVAIKEHAEYKSDVAQSILEALSLADEEGRAALIAVAQLIKKN